MPRMPLRRAKILVNRITDRLGLPVDPKIKPLVTGFLHQGLQTIASCQGHHGRGHPYPWIHFSGSELEALKQILMRYRLNGYWEIKILGIPSKRSLRLKPKRTEHQSLAVMQTKAHQLGKRLWLR